MSMAPTAMALEKKRSNLPEALDERAFLLLGVCRAGLFSAHTFLARRSVQSGLIVLNADDV